MSNTAVVLFAATDRGIVVNPQAQEMVDEALALAWGVREVTNAIENDIASEALRALKQVAKDIEDTRKRIKDPVLDMCRKIDATARKLSEPIDSAIARVSRVTADYQTEQLEYVRRIERQRADEAARIERERQEALAKIEAERLAAVQEAMRKAAQEAEEAKTAKEVIEAKARALAEHERILAENDAKVKAETERQAQAIIALGPSATAPRAEGQTVKPKWEWEVTNIWDLARANPGCVEIAPRRQEINEVIAALAATGTKPKMAGLRIWEEVKVGVRLGKPQTVDV